MRQGDTSYSTVIVYCTTVFIRQHSLASFSVILSRPSVRVREYIRPNLSSGVSYDVREERDGTGRRDKAREEMSDIIATDGEGRGW